VHGRRSHTGGTCEPAGCRQRREPSGEPEGRARWRSGPTGMRRTRRPGPL